MDFDLLAGSLRAKFDLDQEAGSRSWIKELDHRSRVKTLHQIMDGFVDRRRRAWHDPNKFSHLPEKPISLCSAGYIEMSKTHHFPQWTRWCWAAAVIILGLAASIGSANAGPKGDITGTVSKAEPPSKQDGTPAHPFADASQCPSSTDLIIWPSGRSIPRIPPSIAVCFVGSQSFNDDRPTVHLRQR